MALLRVFYKDVRNVTDIAKLIAMDIFKEGTKIFNDSQVNTQPEFKMCSKCVQVQCRTSEIILSFKYADKITIQLFE